MYLCTVIYYILYCIIILCKVSCVGHCFTKDNKYIELVHSLFLKLSCFLHQMKVCNVVIHLVCELVCWFMIL